MATESKFPAETIELPSQGYFYEATNPLSSGTIEIKYMTAREEDILTSRNLIQKGVVIDTLLQSLIVTPINYSELLIGDKNAILVASRILAYGKDYEVNIVCPKCGESSQHTVDISSFENKEVDLSIFTKGSKQFAFQLPISKKNLILKLATHADERNIDAEAKAMKKISAQTGRDSEMTIRFRNIITSIDGETKQDIINKFVNEEMLAQDSLALRKALFHSTPDVDMSYDLECPECNKSSTIQVPLTTDFFWPSGRE